MKIVIPLKLSNWNDIINSNRINKYIGASQKKKEMKDISYFIRNMPKITEYPIKINFTWHVKNIASDLDNKCIKSILDCMQNLGKLQNDNIKHINEITYKATKDKDDYVEMEIEYNGSA